MMGELGEPNALPGGQILLKGRSKRLKNFPGSLLFWLKTPPILTFLPNNFLTLHDPTTPSPTTLPQPK